MSPLWALDIRAIPDAALDWTAIRNGVSASDLPRALVSPQIGSCAVLSWRWDLDLFEGRSRNLALALNHAKRSGVHYLFLDLATVDQTLRGDQLLRQVSGLSSLYRALDVIAVSDRHDSQDWTRDLRRPWMLFEARNYLQTKRNVAYLTTVGNKNVHTELQLIYRTSYSIYVLYALVNHIGMTDPKDFRFIFEPLSEALEFLGGVLSETDFLFAVLVLCVLHDEGQAVERNGDWIDNGLRLPPIGKDQIFGQVEFDRFAFGTPWSPGSYETCRPICLGDVVVAEWRNKMTTSSDRNWLKILPRADEALLRGLGASDAVLASYLSRKTDQLRWMKLEGDPPEVDLYFADTEKEGWATRPPSFFGA